MVKTNAMRLLDAAGIKYSTKEYEYDESDLSGHHAAEVLGIPAEQVFKTLVTKGDKTGEAKPQLKAAFVEESVYVGAQNLEFLSAIKSKNELIGDLVALLQSPAKNVISALQSGANTLHGVLTTLGERAE